MVGGLQVKSDACRLKPCPYSESYINSLAKYLQNWSMGSNPIIQYSTWPYPKI